MNQKYIPAVLVVIMFMCCSCEHNAYKIKGELRGDVNGQYIYLQFADTCRQVLDSAKIENNRFVFEGTASEVRLGNVFLNRKNEATGRISRVNMPLFIEKGEVGLLAHYDSIQPGMVLFDNYNLQGTPSNEMFYKYMKLSAMYDRMDRQLFDIYGDYLSNKEPGRNYFERGLMLTTEMDSLNTQRIRMTMSYIREYADSEVGVVVFTKILSLLSLDEIEAATQFLSGRVKGTAVGVYGMGQVERMKQNAVGSVCADFKLKTPDGIETSLSDYVGRGNYILLEFWASWCGPCKKEIPHIKEVLKAYEKENFQVVGISMDTGNEAWKKAIEEHKVDWVQLSALQGFSGKLPETFRVRGIPTCILLDPQGQIIHRNARGAWLDRFLMTQWGDRFEK